MTTRKHFEEYEGQTRYKHLILGDYLDAWVKILGSKFDRLAYVDGFCGPGTYYDDQGVGHDGSPVIALRVADRHSGRTRVECVFTDKNASFCEQLEEKLRQAVPQGNYAVHAGDFDALMSGVLGAVMHDTPSFVFVDPCGWTGFPMRTIERILSQPRTEVLINFMFNAINRHLTADGVPVGPSFGNLYGFDEAQLETFRDEVAGVSREARERRILDGYLTELRKHAKFVWPFKLKFVDKDRTYYYLIHATNEFLGMKVMKEVMFSAGGQSLAYSALGPQDSQLSMFPEEPTVDDLASYLMNLYAGKERTFDQVLEETYAFTPFIEKHYRAALKDAWRAGTLEVTQVDSQRANALRGADRMRFPTHPAGSLFATATEERRCHVCGSDQAPIEVEVASRREFRCPLCRP